MKTVSKLTVAAMAFGLMIGSSATFVSSDALAAAATSRTKCFCNGEYLKSCVGTTPTYDTLAQNQSFQKNLVPNGSGGQRRETCDEVKKRLEAETGCGGNAKYKGLTCTDTVPTAPSPAILEFFEIE